MRADFYNRADFGNQCWAKVIAADNAQAESFFSRFKAELMEDGVFEDIEQARSEICRVY